MELVRCGCGGEARINDTESGLVYVLCEKCETATRFFRTEKQAITAWNKAMGERTAKVESLVLTTYPSQMVWQCGECGKLILGQVNYCPICGAKLEWK